MLPSKKVLSQLNYLMSLVCASNEKVKALEAAVGTESSDLVKQLMAKD